MDSRQQRAREQFPQVLLAVLGIIQALALELLWERGVAGLHRWRAIDAEWAGILQVLAIFLGIVVLWVLFATLVLRFRWVPRFRDLVSPFVLGGLEFMSIDSMAPELLARWFVLLALIFVAASLSTYLTFQTVFAQDDLGAPRWTRREQLMSYVPALVIVVFLLLSAAAVAWRGPDSGTALAALILANFGLAAQLFAVRAYWYRDLRRTGSA